jgi:Transposase DDE domain group 1
MDGAAVAAGLDCGDEAAHGVLAHAEPLGSLGSRSTCRVNTAGWLKGLRVTADGTSIVSHAGIALIRAPADRTGLTAGLSKALASRRLLIHDRGRVLADLACAIADGGEVISDFRVIGDQEDLFGAVASVPTVADAG